MAHQNQKTESQGTVMGSDEGGGDVYILFRINIIQYGIPTKCPRSECE